MNKNDQPKLQPEFKLLDKFSDSLLFLLLLGLWVYSIIIYQNIQKSAAPLPEEPTMNKNLVFLMPVIATLICGLLYRLNRFPHLFNYPVRVTSQNALKLYGLATRMLRIVNLTIVAMFFGLQGTFYQSIIKHDPLFISFFLIGLPLLSLLIVVYYIVKMYKINRSKKVTRSNDTQI